ncbi:hypothetical protein PYCC9005_003262 [Savitreella phatthalungensis]
MLAPTPRRHLPPHYNRPTNAVQTPALASILRPATGSSRRGTPEQTSDESDAGLAATVESLRPSIVPTYEYYGFALYLSSTILFILYLAWGVFGSQLARAFSLPSEWWSRSIPAWLVVCLAYTYVALACYNTQRLTLPLHDMRTVTDSSAHIAEPQDWARGTNGVLDLPVGAVNLALYDS